MIEPGAGPGPGWQKVGELESDHAPELFRAVQHHLGIYAGSSPRSVRGYITGDTRQVWVQQLDQAADEFHLALGPLDPSGGYLMTNRPARRAQPKFRTPETHPGYVVPPIYIGIEIRAGSDGRFTRC
jgi:hypothetical protein